MGRWRKGQKLEKGHWGQPFLDNAPQTGPKWWSQSTRGMGLASDSPFLSQQAWNHSATLTPSMDWGSCSVALKPVRSCNYSVPNPPKGSVSVRVEATAFQWTAKSYVDEHVSSLVLWLPFPFCLAESRHPGLLALYETLGTLKKNVSYCLCKPREKLKKT